VPDKYIKDSGLAEFGELGRFTLPLLPEEEWHPGVPATTAANWIRDTIMVIPE
jgi:hypothetical protein